MSTSESRNRPDLLRVGTRGSALALAQSRMVVRSLEAARPDFTFIEHIVSTEGDRDKTSPLSLIGGRGVFTSALQQRLLEGEIDLAVHSAKDVPSISPPGLAIAAFPDREDPRDALISRHGGSLAELPANPVIGTSSRRRAVQILALRPDARIRELRGNIDTRLRKSLTDEYDAIVLAVAGVTRMGWADRITELLQVEQFTPAPAQGAIAVETRIGELAEIVVTIDDPVVSTAVRIERLFLRGVGGGCTTPIGAFAEVVGSDYVLHAMLSDDSGSRLVRERRVLDADADSAVEQLGADMLRQTRPIWAAGISHGTVLMTGSRSQTSELLQHLTGSGFNPLHLETIRIESPHKPIEVQVGDRFDWAIITSPNAFPFANNVLEPLVNSGTRLAVVGARTAEVAKENGFTPEVIGKKDAVSLADTLVDAGISGKRIICLTSDLARPTLPDRLRHAGAEVHVVSTYRTVPADRIEPEAASRIASESIVAVTFASPSAVQSFRTLLGAHVAALSGASFVAIGDTTADAMRQSGLPVHSIATQPNAAALVEAIKHSIGADVGGNR